MSSHYDSQLKRRRPGESVSYRVSGRRSLRKSEKKVLRRPKPSLWEEDDDKPIAEWSSWILLVALVGQIVWGYMELTGGIAFSEGLFFDANILRVVLMTIMSAPAAFLLLFHTTICVRIFETGMMKIFSALTCTGTYYVTFNVLYVVFGGFAHVHANAVDYYCIRHAKGNEALCREAKTRMSDMPDHYRKLVKKSAGFYGQVSGKSEKEDLAFMGLVKQLSSRRDAPPENPK